MIYSLKLECEKLASEKIEIQRHYVMVSFYLFSSSLFLCVLFFSQSHLPSLLVSLTHSVCFLLFYIQFYYILRANVPLFTDNLLLFQLISLYIYKENNHALLLLPLFSLPKNTRTIHHSPNQFLLTAFYAICSKKQAFSPNKFCSSFLRLNAADTLAPLGKCFNTFYNLLHVINLSVFFSSPVPNKNVQSNLRFSI